MDRVFIPLMTECFNDFGNGKCWEVRKVSRQWNRDTLRPGRHATVSHGYSGKRIEGAVGKVITGQSLKNIINRLPLRKVEPRAKSRTEAVSMNLAVLGKAPEYIAFEIKF